MSQACTLSDTACWFRRGRGSRRRASCPGNGVGRGRCRIPCTPRCCSALSQCVKRTESLTHATEGFTPCQRHFHLPFRATLACSALAPGFIFKKCSGAASPLLGQAMKQPLCADSPPRRGTQFCPRRGAARRQSSNLPLPGGRLPSGALGLCTAECGQCRDRGCSGEGCSWSNASRGGRLSVIFLYLE